MLIFGLALVAIVFCYLFFYSLVNTITIAVAKEYWKLWLLITVVCFILFCGTSFYLFAALFWS